jgi:hypothetical protein
LYVTRWKVMYRDEDIHDMSDGSTATS